MNYKETHPLYSTDQSLNVIQRLWVNLAWWIIEKIVAIFFAEQCQQAEASYQRKKLEEWVDAFEAEPREPGEQQRAYSEMMREQYSRVPIPEGDDRVKWLEDCWKVEYTSSLDGVVDERGEAA
mgnify:CR=1 FL=1